MDDSPTEGDETLPGSPAILDFTRWLNASTESRDDELFAGLYTELKRIAGARMAGERSDHTLNATALVHEAWLRLEKTAPDQWRDRKHFFAAVSEAMRRILVEAARRRLAAKRGGNKATIPEDEVNILAPIPDDRLLAVHEVLDQMEQEDEMKARIVKLRFFGGMNNDEIAALLEVNEKTVRRHWTVAKVWLYRALEEKK
ncbi:ECF-type sigma factor [bacterium]|nr:ECF-type sigma factor [bacterium]MDC0259203.1 ECF-type sigma factor [Verrucomicrobiales bacterium]MDC0322598.1 ECF-type sigma factor [Verrucomicrobiales bacterium]